MTRTLPHDFPEVGRQALEPIRKVHTPTYIKVLEFIGANWGDLNAIDYIIKIWASEIKTAQQSTDRLQRNLSKLKNAAAEGYWEGAAREEYVNWREDFHSNTLQKYLDGMQSVKEELDAIHGNIFSIRGHTVATVIEIGAIAAGIIASETGVGVVVAIAGLIAYVGTLLDYEFRVTGDLDDKGRNLENIRMKTQLDRGGGAVSAPFRGDIIKDWSDWETKK
jgi:uncharacterized protein YukE